MLSATIHLMPLRAALSLGNFFCALQFFLVLYVLAPFLATFMPAEATGLVIAAGSLLTLLSFPFVPRLVRAVGARSLFLVLLALSFTALVLLSFGPQLWSVVLLIAIFCAVQPLIAYLLDLLLEATVKAEEATGRLRTAFITCANLALVAAPLLVGFLLGSSNAYERLFLIAGLSLIPAFLLLCCVRIPKHASPHFASMRQVLTCLLKDKDVFAVGVANMTLQFFYHIAPFFVPLYLHNVLGIPWSELGWMFSVALIPFVVLEYPAGWLADRVFGDKEIMAIGFLFIGSAFAALAFVTEDTPMITLVITLLLSRIGAALTEATAESHFFRRVSEQDVDSVGIFRMLRPVAALAAPVVGSLFLVFTTYNVFFFVAGIGIVIVGIASALSIRDVR